LKLGGEDLRRDPLEVRKAPLPSVLAKVGAGVRFCEHLDFDDGATVFQHACAMELEGVVSKRKDSLYPLRAHQGLAEDGEPACEAVKRESIGGEAFARSRFRETWARHRVRLRQAGLKRAPWALQLAPVEVLGLALQVLFYNLIGLFLPASRD
jgi:hypothetical protein